MRPTCCVLGGGVQMVSCLELLANRQWNIVGIFSSDDAGMEWAKSRKIHCGDYGDAAITAMAEKSFDYLFSIANWNVLPPGVLSLPRKLAINYHDSPLPRYAGGNATTWALLNRETTHAVTWHIMEARIDTGPILKQVTVPIDANETALTLDTKCFEAAARSFNELLEDLEAGEFQPMPQASKQRSYFGRYKRPPSGSVISWLSGAEAMDSMVRALDFGTLPNPLAKPKVWIKDQLFSVGKLDMTEAAKSSPPGTILHADSDVIEVSTATRDVRLSKLKTLDGSSISPARTLENKGLTIGCRLEDSMPEMLGCIERIDQSIGEFEAFWIDQMIDVQTPRIDVFGSTDGDKPPRSESVLHLPGNLMEATTSAPDAGDLLLTVFLAFLSRLANQETFSLGLSEESLEQELDCTGDFFARIRPCRFDVDLSLPLPGGIAACSRQLAAAREHITFSQDLLQRDSRLLQTPRQYPVMVHFGDGPPASPGQIVMTISPNRGEWSWYSSNSLIGPEVFQSWHSRFCALLKKVAASPETPLGAHSLFLSEAEYKTVVFSWNRTRTDISCDLPIHQVFREQASCCPDRTAVTCDGEVHSYSELDQQSDRIAVALIQQGVQTGHSVGLFMDRSADTVSAILGVLKAGGVYVPADTNAPANRVLDILNDSGARLVIVDNQTVSNGFLRDFDGTVATAETLSKTNVDEEISLPQVEADDAAYIIYTSGSTGRPKGTVIEHRGLVDYVQWAAKNYVRNDVLAFPLFSSLSFDLTVTSIFVPLVTGGQIVTYPEQHPSGKFAIERVLEDNAVDIIKLTPSHLALWGQADARQSRIRRMIVGGEDLKRSVALAVHHAFRGALEMFNEYGPTEAVVGCMIHRFDPKSDLSPSVPIGKPADNVQLFVVDELMNPLPPGFRGELCISGVGLAREYLHRPDLTAERFVPIPWAPENRMYRTGDLARWRPDGVMEFFGRMDNQVKIRGHRVELGEIESLLNEHPEISACVVDFHSPADESSLIVDRGACFLAKRDFLSQITETDVVLLPSKTANLNAYMERCYAV